MVFVLQTLQLIYAIEMKYVRKIQGKTKIERIRFNAVRIGLGIIPLEEKKELAELRDIGGVDIMGVASHLPGKIERKLRASKEENKRLGWEGY
jgi:hypothetical protein